MERILHLCTSAGVPFFPKLHTLRIDGDYFRDPFVLSILQGSPLSRVAIRGDGIDNEDLNSLILELVERWPGIRSLAFNELNEMDGDVDVVALAALRELQVARVTGISLRTWSSLASCSALREATIFDHEDPDYSEASDFTAFEKGPVNHLPSLQKLTIRYTPICSAILASSDMPNLRTLRVSSMQDEDGEVCTTVVGRSRHLEEVNLKLDMGALESTTLKAFAGALGLRKIILRGDVTAMRIVDRDIALLARSLPRL